MGDREKYQCGKSGGHSTLYMETGMSSGNWKEPSSRERPGDENNGFSVRPTTMEVNVHSS